MPARAGSRPLLTDRLLELAEDIRDTCDFVIGVRGAPSAANVAMAHAARCAIEALGVIDEQLLAARPELRTELAADRRAE
jgi:hypothetical protein